MNILGKKLKLLRSAKMVNQEEASKAIGIERSTYGGYEIGKREPNLETLIKIANYYDCSIDYLLGVTTSPKREKDSEYTIAVDYLKEKNISIDKLKRLLEYVQTLDK